MLYDKVSSLFRCFFVSTINFSFWPDLGNHFTVSYNNRQETGYIALCALFKKALEVNIPITECDFYLNSSYENVKSIFIGDDGHLIPMFDARYECLLESAKVLKEKFAGSFLECLKIADGSAKNLLCLILKHFTSFRDYAEYDGRTGRFSFLKRAQILISDVYHAFNGRKPADFTDLDVLTMFADYRVPQVLAYFGVLKYDGSLSQILEKNQFLENGNPMEVEIRGCSIFAVEEIVEKVNEMLLKIDCNASKINAASLDYFLWNYRRAHAAEIEEKFPFHKTRCIYY
uniref:Queuosine 5'-phosphate N-glycosylase/hydrolase n=1 Tax=Romanomermis culicivorax TaxID=13658 RepID=A0A915JQI9_ROMCU